MEAPNINRDEKEIILELLDYVIYLTKDKSIKEILRDIEKKVEALHD